MKPQPALGSEDCILLDDLCLCFDLQGANFGLFPMKASNPSTSKAGRVTRRTFLRSGAIVTTVMAAPALSTRLQANKNSQLQIFQIGVGGIGGLQRNNLKNHKRSRFVGFCDVDQQELDKMG
ncbi:MAG: hypothetical protein VW804_02475, partial [Verrucomicrobiota bacterium]